MITVCKQIIRVLVERFGLVWPGIRKGEPLEWIVATCFRLRCSLVDGDLSCLDVVMSKWGTLDIILGAILSFLESHSL